MDQQRREALIVLAAATIAAPRLAGKEIKNAPYLHATIADAITVAEYIVRTVEKRDMRPASTGWR